MTLVVRQLQHQRQRQARSTTPNLQESKTPLEASRTTQTCIWRPSRLLSSTMPTSCFCRRIALTSSTTLLLFGVKEISSSLTCPYAKGRMDCSEEPNGGLCYIIKCRILPSAQGNSCHCRRCRRYDVCSRVLHLTQGYQAWLPQEFVRAW